jgi:hypothetical protein
MGGINNRKLSAFFFIAILWLSFTPTVMAHTNFLTLNHQIPSIDRNDSYEIQSSLNSKSSSIHSLYRIKEFLAGFQGKILQRDLSTSMIISDLTTEDLEETEDVQLTFEITQLAVDTFESDPLKIFLFVYNEIGYVPYGWSLQGSSMTLSTGYGNDYDQASLLIALYRAAGFPARYVQGPVKVTPERMRNWMGVDDDIMPFWVGMLGNMIVIPEWSDVGSIDHYSVIHCWVKVYIDGEWLEVDPSFKEFKHFRKMDFSDFIDPIARKYSGEIKPETLFRVNKEVQTAIYSKIESLPDDTTFKQVAGGKLIIKASDYVSPPDPVNPEATVESARLKTTDRYHVAFMFPIPDASKPFGFSLTRHYVYNTSTVALANKRITLSFPPATDADFDVINSYGGILQTPCDEFYVKPVLLIDGQPVLVGDPMRPGKVFSYKIISYYPYYSSHRVNKDWNIIWEKDTISGSYIAISLDLMNPPLDYGQRIKNLQGKLDQERINLDDMMGEILNGKAMVFWYELHKYASIIAEEYDVVRVFEAPGIVLSGYEIRKKSISGTEYLRFAKSIMDIHVATGFLPKTTTHPANVIREGGGEYAQEDPKAVTAQFLYGVFGAQLEGYVHYLLYNSPPTSALYLVSLADELGIPIHIINSQNIDNEIELLDYDEETKSTLRSFLEYQIDRGKTIMIPESSLKNQILTITITTKEEKYTPQRYLMFDAVSYLTFDEKGRFGSHMLLTYNGGFSGVSDDSDNPTDTGGDSRVNSDQSLVSNINDPENSLEPGKQTTINQNTADITLDQDGKEIQVTQKTVKAGDVIATGVKLVSKVVGHPVSKTASKVSTVTTVISVFVDSGVEYGHYVQNSKDSKIVKGIKGGGMFVGEVVVKCIGTVVSLVVSVPGGLYGLVKGVFGEDTGMPLNEAKKQAVDSFNAVDNFVNDVTSTVRRTLFDLDPNTGKPNEWRKQKLELYPYIIPISSPTSSDPVNLASRVSNQSGEGWYAWLISSSGLTVGSYLGDEIVTDMPYIYFEEIDNSTLNFYIWNPKSTIKEGYLLTISNQANDAINYHVYIDLSSSGESESEKVDLSLEKGEEISIPLQITTNPAEGEKNIKVGDPQSVYTISFTIGAPTTFQEHELFLDDEYLTSMKGGFYKVLTFPIESAHTLIVYPDTIEVDGDNQTLQSSKWEFTERGEKIFQYSSGVTPPIISSPYSGIFQSLDQYIPYIGAIVAILVASIAFFTFRKRSRITEAKAPVKGMKYCISCGAQIKASTQYCTKCGESQE